MGQESFRWGREGGVQGARRKGRWRGWWWKLPLALLVASVL